MKNNIFDVSFNEKSGLMEKISLCNDKDNMNWISDSGFWGKIHHRTNVWVKDGLTRAKMELKSFEETLCSSKAVFSNGFVEVTMISRFEGESLVQEFKIKNISETVLFLNENNFAIEIPFNDKYTYADDCLVHRCNTHIWCGGNTTYVDALKMGVSENNLGLVVTKGSFKNYSVLECCTSNARGRFLLNLEQTEILNGEEFVVEWKLFSHTGKEDFMKKAVEIGGAIEIKAEHFTVFKGEKIKFVARTKEKVEKVRVFCKNKEIEYSLCNEEVLVEYCPEKEGEYRVFVEINGKKTWADFVVKVDFETLVKNRINYIVDKQQYNKENSPLYGAYLIYDTKQEHPIFEDEFSDHNASRERIGMALLICKYLQKKRNEKFYNSLMKYMDFLKREFYDEETGTVYNTIGKNPNLIRLYNAPWVGTLFMEMYKLTGEESYLDEILKLYKKYYETGGSKFYPNAVSIRETANVFLQAGRKDDYKKIVGMFKIHVDNMVKNKTSYPPHEVNYEQTIVTPATTLISEFSDISKDKKYTDEAKCHVEILERFSGHQPSFHLYEIPIRYWDDFWFGKFMTNGDTFPHYWSCLSARSFNDYYRVTKEKRYLKMAEECMRNCMCLFTDDGKGSAAYLYPFRLGETFGEIYDEWANDQDFALYYALETGLIKY